jgi:peptidoglycan/xylan/chitin deacetylase (PgdA/CDA1 family)
VVSIARKLGAIAICRSGVGRILDRAGNAVRGRSLRVLTYHRVPRYQARAPEVQTGIERGVEASAFRQQIRSLVAEYEVVDLTQVAAWLRSDTELPPRAAAITFDDGYRDVHDNAFPILKEYGIPATVFLASAFVGTSELFWWDRLSLALKALDRPVGQEDWIDVECPRSVARLLRNWPGLETDSKAQAIEAIADGLKVLGPERLSAVVDRLWILAGSPEDAAGEYALLSWDQVREMSHAGVSFGAHTVHHTILTTVDDRTVEREVSDSRRQIEAELGSSVTAFCYPSGAHSDAIRTIVRERGFTCAFATTRGINRRGVDPYAVKRISVGPSAGAPFELRLLASFYDLRGLTRPA